MPREIPPDYRQLISSVDIRFVVHRVSCQFALALHELLQWYFQLTQWSFAVAIHFFPGLPRWIAFPEVARSAALACFQILPDLLFFRLNQKWFFQVLTYRNLIVSP